MTTTIKAGDRFLFDYPPAFTSLPEHTAHTGAEVEIIRPLVDGEEYDREDGEPMFRVRADDGWEGDAWESELAPLGLPLGTIRGWCMAGEELVTIHVSPYITWQGPASRAAEAGRF